MQFIPGQGLDLVIEELGRLRRRPRPVGVGAPEQAAKVDRPKTPPVRDRALSQVARSLLTGRFEVPPVDGSTPPPGAPAHLPTITAPVGTVAPAETPPAEPVPRPS